jgi:hypothetical protein
VQVSEAESSKSQEWRWHGKPGAHPSLSSAIHDTSTKISLAGKLRMVGQEAIQSSGAAVPARPWEATR